MKNLEPRLTNVTVPTLVVQGLKDPLVNSEETARMFDQIGAAEKRYLPLDFSRHGILAGEGSENVHAEISAFIGRL
jgi:esterase/lipase